MTRLRGFSLPYFPLKSDVLKKQCRKNISEHSLVWEISKQTHPYKSSGRSECSGCGRQETQRRSSYVWHVSEPEDGCLCLYCTCVLLRSQRGTGGRERERWALDRKRNSQFVFVPFTQKPRRVIACSTPRRWKVGGECGGWSHSLL